VELAKLFSVLDIRVVKEIHISIKLIANKISCQMLIQNDVKPIVLMVFSLHKKTKGLVNLLIVTVATHEISLANDYL
jgi:hypothetical protein